MTDTLPDQANINFTLSVTIDANGESHEELRRHIEKSLQYAIDTGALTGHSMATVDEHSFQTKLIGPEAAALDEDEIASWLSIQIEDGHMRLEDLSKLMARYALSEPGDMRMELAERMGLLPNAETAPVRPAPRAD